jgi:GNAT superfamily N-acetyltransferase
MDCSEVTDATMCGAAAQPSIPLHPDQVEQAAAMLARAFQDDPLPHFLFPDTERRRQHLPALFAWWLQDALRDGEVRCHGPVLAVAIWTPPQATAEPQPEAAEAAAAWRDGTRLLTTDERDRLERYVEYVDALHARLMPDPHAALFAIGVEPAHQGRGLGTTLMAPTLARLTTAGIPCYLDTGTARNVRFYERHGFRVLAEGVVPGSSLRIWAMRRD